jgi:hypothetical protein
MITYLINKRERKTLNDNVSRSISYSMSYEKDKLSFHHSFVGDNTRENLSGKVLYLFADILLMEIRLVFRERYLSYVILI